MSTKTHAGYGDPKNMVQQAVGLFATHMQRNSTMNRLTGSMPKGEAGATATLRRQTTQHMPIVRCQDLSKGKGDEVTFHLLNPVGAKPIMGSQYAEGRGVGLSITEDKLRVDQARFPIDLGDTMTSLRSPVDFRRLGRPVAQNLMDRYVDQTLLVHMAGARGFQNNIEWVVPPETDADFARIMVNPVKAPTKNRHFLADGSGIKPFATTGATTDPIDIASTDALKMDTVDSIRTLLDMMPLPPPIVKFEGDSAAEDNPLRVLMVSPAQYRQFSTDPAFRQLQATALARASQAKNSAVFRGDAGLWQNILIIKMPRPIRFYAGQPVRWCPNFNSETEAAATVPAGFGANFAIDRAVLLGGQAIAEALAASEKSRIPFFWSEKELDHADKVELLIGAIRAASKIRFEVDTGTGKEFTDYGCMAIDTVVPTIGGK